LTDEPTLRNHPLAKGDANEVQVEVLDFPQDKHCADCNRFARVKVTYGPVHGYRLVAWYCWRHVRERKILTITVTAGSLPSAFARPEQEPNVIG